MASSLKIYRHVLFDIKYQLILPKLSFKLRAPNMIIDQSGNPKLLNSFHPETRKRAKLHKDDLRPLDSLVFSHL
jgi:hypothetical protein